MKNYDLRKQFLVGMTILSIVLVTIILLTRPA